MSSSSTAPLSTAAESIWGKLIRQEFMSLSATAPQPTAAESIGRGGQAMLGSIQTHSFRRLNSRWAINAKQEVGEP